MAPTRPAPAPASAAPDYGLTVLGLSVGETVRWRQGLAGGGGRWRVGAVTRRERDGSVGVTDQRGLARSLPVDRLEVGTTGPRGGKRWEALAARAGRTEQLRLL